MGKIFYVMGKSSSGKDTIYKQLRERDKALRTVVPYTTRPIREGETEGVEYFFVDKDKLVRMREDRQIIEERSYNTKCGVWTYFTADDGQIDLEKYDYLMIGTLVSYSALKEYFGAEKIVPVYIQVENGERLLRAVAREQKEAAPKYFRISAWNRGEGLKTKEIRLKASPLEPRAGLWVSYAAAPKALLLRSPPAQG